jgi:Heavy metal binding domain
VEQNNMRRTKWKTIAALVAMTGIAGLAVTGCQGSSHNENPGQSTGEATSKNGQTVHYTCSMHPEVLQDKPGDCPKCGMKLVEKR